MWLFWSLHCGHFRTIFEEIIINYITILKSKWLYTLKSIRWLVVCCLLHAVDDDAFLIINLIVWMCLWVHPHASEATYTWNMINQFVAYFFYCFVLTQTIKRTKQNEKWEEKKPFDCLLFVMEGEEVLSIQMWWTMSIRIYCPQNISIEIIHLRWSHDAFKCVLLRIQSRWFFPPSPPFSGCVDFNTIFHSVPSRLASWQMIYAHHHIACFEANRLI